MDPVVSGAADVEAAGGVIWRVQGDEVEVVLVHRPRYDDWTLPKGKLDPGESHEAAACREMLEETGYEVVLGRELAATRYVDNRGRQKRVRYWEMTVAGGSFAPNDEVDELRWLPLPDALGRLSYPRDADVLRSFATFARTGS